MNIVVAHNNKNVIGKNNKIPWHSPEDMAHFKELTMGSIVVMGRNTWESIPKKHRPLCGRINVVLSSSMPEHEDVIIKRSIDDVLSFLKDRPEKVYIIGGQSIYEQFISRVTNIYLTKINNNEDGDTFFNEKLLENFRIEKITALKNDCLFYNYLRHNSHTFKSSS